MELLEFYPTPQELLKEITAGIKWYSVKTILEPSAGKGDIVHFIEKQYPYNTPNIDCIEKEEVLRNHLVSAGYRVVSDDFLSYETFKAYDLIIMNPPFSNGDEHLLKAMSMQKRYGGAIICILNAETLRNAYSNRRKELVQKLNEQNAIIEYKEQAFKNAERATNVEIAIVKVQYEKPKEQSSIFDDLKKKNYREERYDRSAELASADYVKAMVNSYELEVAAGLELIRTYENWKNYIYDSREENNVPQLKLCVPGENDLTINAYIEKVREKYWTILFLDERITGKLTSNLRYKYLEKVQSLKEYDFSTYNIRHLMNKMISELSKGVEDCIVKLFDELSYEHSWNNEFSNNIHYFNGWKTNKSWYINKKVIIPLNAFSRFNGSYDPDYRTIDKLRDIEKALSFLDTGTTKTDDISNIIRNSRETGQNKKIDSRYFTIDFYKKGTCHLNFKDDDLLKRFNLYGSQQKGWLPPSYGKAHYDEMSPEEQNVIDSFEGQKSYEQVMKRPEYYIKNSNIKLLAI